MGRPTATNGSPCVVPADHLVLELGYRDQVTTGAAGTSTLEVFPLALMRIGLGARMEFLALPPSQANRGGATLGGVFTPTAGVQDLGFGFKVMLHDRAGFQDAAGVFYTAPTGTQGPFGFSAGAPTYTVSYTFAVPLGRFGVSVTQNAISLPFFSYQPSVTLSYNLAPNVTLLASDQITTPLTANGGTANRALFAVQRVLSPGVVLDAEYETNVLPAAPVLTQHAFGIGGALAF